MKETRTDLKDIESVTQDNLKEIVIFMLGLIEKDYVLRVYKDIDLMADCFMFTGLLYPSSLSTYVYSIDWNFGDQHRKDLVLAMANSGNCAKAVAALEFII